MNIKKRDMKLTGTFDNQKEYFSKKINIGSSEAIVSIIKFKEIDKPVEVHYNFKDETIINSNYTWIQIAVKGSNFWIKSMYDENDDLVEIYIDVTRNNYFDDETNPTYEDLFLDIVIPKKGHIYQMDDVELMKAFTEGIITEGEYKLSKIVCHNLITYLNDHLKEFLDFVTNLKLELREDLKNQSK